MGRGYAWFDTGNADSLLEASLFINFREKTWIKIACLEEIAFDQGFINNKKLTKIINKMADNSCSSYLRSKLKMTIP